MTLLPPAKGAILIIPVGAEDVIAPALDGGAALVGVGPVPGSIIVHGELKPIAARLGRALILRAPRVGCGDPR